MNVFISYRRHDSTHAAQRVRMSLQMRFGEGAVFIDREIPPGMDWHDHLESMLVESTAVVVLVGDEFLRLLRKHRDRPGGEEDALGWEIATALRLRKPIYPVLFGRGDMPSGADLPEPIRPFAKIQAVFAREPAFDSAMVALGNAIRVQHGLDEKAPVPAPAPAATPLTRIALNAFAVTLLLVATTWFIGSLIGMLGQLPTAEDRVLELPFWRGARYVLSTLLLGLGPYVSYYLVAVLRARMRLPGFTLSSLLTVLNVCGVLLTGGVYLLMSTIPGWRLRPLFVLTGHPTLLQYTGLAAVLLLIVVAVVAIAVWEPKVRTLEDLSRTFGILTLNSFGLTLGGLILWFAVSLMQSSPPMGSGDPVALLGYGLLCPTLSLLYFHGWTFGRSQLGPVERGWEFNFLFLLVLALVIACTVALYSYGVVQLFGPV
ncbi:MAG TPA: toll/interleukin-1 receptor domain-containing protein [Albitalea sp.]|uniref:toll/interleukin-1 receptor domain-containing protein n=1 Tax=Piscinibacter sp. TaxID=1903157 RepID=UPI002ED351F0